MEKRIYKLLLFLHYGIEPQWRLMSSYMERKIGMVVLDLNRIIFYTNVVFYVVVYSIVVPKESPTHNIVIIKPVTLLMFASTVESIKK